MAAGPIEDLRALLRLRPALIVHFSGLPKGTGHPLRYPEDLRAAVVETDEILSCSTVEPAGVWPRPQSAIGPVGLIIDPVSQAGLVLASHECCATIRPATLNPPRQ